MGNIFAYTAATGQGYPPYVSINRLDNGDVKVSVRGEPEIVDGIYVCAHRHEKGQAGRCTPGDANCNNYCNMAPEKGPMQDHPLPCTHIYEGPYSEVVIPAAEWARMAERA